MANTTSNLDALIQSWYDKKLLKRVDEVVVLDQFGQQRPVPPYEGKTITFSRYLNLGLATTALTEGTNPAGSNLSAENVSATVQQYGDFVQISDFVSLVALDPKISQKIPILAEQMGKTLDFLINTEIAVNATEQLVSTVTDVGDITATDVLTMTDVRLAKRTLLDNKATPYGDGYFVGVLDPFTQHDLMNDSLWIDSGKYKDNVRLYKGEIGSWYGIRFVYTTQPYRTDTSETYSATGAVHPTLIMGKEAYGITKIKGGKDGMTQGAGKIIVKTPGTQDTGNPLNMYSTAGWKCNFVAKTLNDDFIINLKSGATA